MQQLVLQSKAPGKRLMYCCLQLALVVLLSACGKQAETIILATTTSTQDSGLLDVVVPMFRDETHIEMKVIAVGTGQALQIGRRGDADVLLVHDPAAEKRFMDEGHGSLHRRVMHNDFILVGPAADPAGIRGIKSIVEAFVKLANTHSAFVSRGDESGTHLAERRIWELAGIAPMGDWYIAAGTGMGQVLRMASEKRAYTLSDRGTFLSQRASVELELLCEKDPILFNPYSVIVVNPVKHANVHAVSAERFANFLLSEKVQKTIAEFGRAQFGQPLFFPDAGNDKK